MARKLPTNHHPFQIKAGDKFCLVRLDVKLVLGDDVRVQPVSVRLSHEEYKAYDVAPNHPLKCGAIWRNENVLLKKRAFEAAVRKQGQLPPGQTFLDGGVSVQKESWLTATDRPSDDTARLMSSGTSAVH